MSGTYDMEKLTKSIEDRVKKEIKESMIKKFREQKGNFRIAKDRNEYMEMAFSMDRLKTIADLMCCSHAIDFGEHDNMNREIMKLKDE